MGKPPPKPTGRKEKSTSSKISLSTNLPRRKTSSCNSARRKPLADLPVNNTDENVDDEDPVSFDTSMPVPNSDMSGDDDEPQQTTAGQPQEPSSVRTRVSAVHNFADKLSPHEYKCKLCSKTYRCSLGSNANIGRHLAMVHGKTNLFSKSQLPDAPTSLPPGRKKMLDEAAIKAIVIDSRSFGDFRRAGMQEFLCIAIPGYFGPTARTVQQNLTLYGRMCPKGHFF